MKKTQARLADGREIIYFDESDDAVREARDPRDLPAFLPRPSVRYDALLDEWVGLADHRQGRPYLPPDDQCPLCPSTPGAADGDSVGLLRRRRVREPVPFLRGPARRGPDLGAEAGLWQQRGGAGRCEVVCFTADHDSSFSALTPRARGYRHRRVDGPHAGAVRAAARGAGLLLREPRRRDRRHPVASARPDLRVPVPDAEDQADDGRGPRAPRAHLAESLRRRARRRAAERGTGRPARRALDRLRPLRRPLAARGARLSAPAAS